MTVYRLDKTLRFPAVHLASADGLLAVGGDLHPDRLLEAYARGIFPWPHDQLPLLWFAPDQRMALEPSAVRVSRSLRAALRRGDVEVRFDTDFRGVIRGCATAPRPGQDGTWIDADMTAAYTRLHELGFAHSVETWRDDELVGGLYGVSLGGMFFGESMFSRETDASKIAFVTLAQRLAALDFLLIDCQMYTDHLASLGASLQPRREYMQVLAEGLARPTLRGRWVAAGDRIDVRVPVRSERTATIPRDMPPLVAPGAAGRATPGRVLEAQS
jgi:leucyl/phenylalanyl-tRNA--protein transferase